MADNTTTPADNEPKAPETDPEVVLHSEDDDAATADCNGHCGVMLAED